jgi:hypothetical protein
MILALFLLPGCSDVLDPARHAGEERDERVRGSFSLHTSQIQLDTLRYVSEDWESWRITTANTAPGFGISQPSGKVIASVPLFDPALGELIAIDLTVTGYVELRMQCHARAPFTAYCTAGGAATTQASANPALGALIGRTAIDLRAANSDHGEWAGIPVAEGETRSGVFDSYHFQHSYTGSDAQTFVRGHPNDALTLTHTHAKYLRGGASHQSPSLAQYFFVDTDIPVGQTKPGSKGAVLFLLDLIADLDRQTHGGITGFYSDLHAAAYAEYDIQVRYIYNANRSPECTAAAPSVLELWPPNGRFVPIDVHGVTDPDGDPITIYITGILQDEPTNGSADATGVGTGQASVRAFRAGGGDGRVYHIGFRAEDGRGGACSGTVRVDVPHDRSRPAVDGGALHDATT